ncbi:MAG: hypothetical protein ABWU14_12940, partial [Limnospira maxima]
MRCDQKPTPGCNGREMLTGHGLIVRLGVESEVTFIPSHSEPCMKVSLHTAPSLIVPLLRIQRWRCQMPFYH